MLSIVFIIIIIIIRPLSGCHLSMEHHSTSHHCWSTKDDSRYHPHDDDDDTRNHMHTGRSHFPSSTHYDHSTRSLFPNRSTVIQPQQPHGKYPSRSLGGIRIRVHERRSITTTTVAPHCWLSSSHEPARVPYIRHVVASPSPAAAATAAASMAAAAAMFRWEPS